MIGIFGGTFDPVHYGHLRPVDEVRRALHLREVHIVPCKWPPHRDAPIATTTQRLRMLTLALSEFPALQLDERELGMDGPSYTVNTLTSFRHELGDVPLCLIMGADAFGGLETWHQWQQLPELAHLVVMARPGSDPGHDAASLPEWAQPRISDGVDELRTRPAGRILFQSVTPVSISATEVRAAIAAGEDVANRVPPPVWDYIREEHIYGFSESTPGSAEVTHADEMKDLAITALEDAKGRDIHTMDVRGLTDITDYMLVVSGTSDRHVRSVADKLVDAMKQHGYRPLGAEGEAGAEWILVDFGDIVVHLMLPKTRELYDLEKLWGEDMRASIEAQRENSHE